MLWTSADIIKYLYIQQELLRINKQESGLACVFHINIRSQILMRKSSILIVTHKYYIRKHNIKKYNIKKIKEKANKIL